MLPLALALALAPAPALALVCHCGLVDWVCWCRPFIVSSVCNGGLETGLEGGDLCMESKHGHILQCGSKFVPWQDDDS